MEPLSSVASIITVIQLSSDIVCLIKAAKGTTKERKRLRDEIRACALVLQQLRDEVDDSEEGEAWTETIKLLEAPSGPLSRLWAVLDIPKTKLEPQRGLKGIFAVLQWPFQEREVDKILAAIEREKSLLQLALDNNSRKLAQKLSMRARESDDKLVELKNMVQSASDDQRRLLSGLKDELSHVRESQQIHRFGDIVAWLSPPDPRVEYNAALLHREPGTGSWLLRSRQYQRWKAGQVRHLWLQGKTGCGKSVLCSTVIEDVRACCKTTQNAGYAIHYFTLLGNQEQSCRSLLLSLIAQLGCKEPALSQLCRMYERRSLPNEAALENVLLSSIQQHDHMTLVLDALDECPELQNARTDMLDCLLRLARNASNLRMFCSSLPLSEIKASMDQLDADVVSIDTQAVDADIGKYLRSELRRDRRLQAFDEHAKIMVTDILTQKADGMFRWASCQLNQLKTLKSTKPKRLKEALQSLPSTLYATYERMLSQIEERDCKDALTALRWLAFEQRPLTLEEIAEATIVDPSGSGVVETDNRGGAEDLLEILGGLVTTDQQWDRNDDDNKSQMPPAHFMYTRSDIQAILPPEYRHAKARVRLAHNSVKKYLMSECILGGKAKAFHLSVGREHSTLAQSCLTYLLHYSNSPLKTRTKEDRRIFPLLLYSAQSWFLHTRLQGSGDPTRSVRLLRSDVSRQDWMYVLRDEYPWDQPLWEEPINNSSDVKSGLYYACLLGLQDVAEELLSIETDLNKQKRECSNALLITSAKGYEKLVTWLIKRGADIDVARYDDATAIQIASYEGHDEVVNVLTDRGASINAEGGFCGTALQAASFGGHHNVVKILVERGANVNAKGGFYGNALQAASVAGHGNVVKMLIEQGAEVNVEGGRYGSALQAALWKGHDDVVKILIERGGVASHEYGSTLQSPCSDSYRKVVERHNIHSSKDKSY